MSVKKLGKFPFTKGIYKDMYRNRLWTMRQYAGFSSVSESNQRYLSLLESGVSGLSVAFDLPTQMGYDSDDDMSSGEIGKSGVPISTPEDIESLFDKIDLEKVSLSMTINSTASILLAFYISLAKKRGYSLNKLRGTLQNDILKEYIARGTYIFPITPSLRLTTDIFEYCQENLPNWNSISVSGYHIREAGSTAIQELAFTFANAITYLESAKAAGIDIEKLTTQISFFFNSHRNFFEEVAKFRAAREIWAHIVRDRFKITNIKSQLCRFHVQTAGSTLTAQQIENNTARTTLQSLAAVLGGAQSIHTNGKDEALSLPSEENALSALRIQQVIAHESGIPEFIDPIGDSSLIEDMTNDITKKVTNKIDEIISKGGVEKLIQNGTIPNEIAESSIEFQNNLDNKKAIVIGVNKFISKESNVQKKIPDLEENRLEIIKKFKSTRNEKDVSSALLLLEEKAKTKENLIPYIIDCSDHKCTLGEISTSLKKAFGEYSL
ncbi:methylmalonyl-CoA mutase family protein [Candidatus Marinimicrobia bacterium]|jgi:methylmalonyl-CoA mutase N-terminal domain/subunit|nr:methylmalonyl-CoA mutase family protein [Candidatus Neomarinimicrobiota bacterium]MDC0593900.1 methylmalonyl-CoA mutase family protein [Candidatus Neomarinimicrobiota bacterium]MDC1000727.1 methylmalonyl-CoA mutase family protein [Candidatus Neomarinimicrobiota bacterium]MDC1020897.1 methylmalonyl-CoA mutase family protein [Candidatus Neomarinimicrobiota bacterium]MDC3287528.1 methylmalonyl-CoA mutase family protein [Candidatus Neomarinimicrobiota bacterium]|tara:strand:- start:11 stop:1492 length:1482 start_codon:yes stop_codon:yes gene_type:complete